MSIPSSPTGTGPIPFPPIGASIQRVCHRPHPLIRQEGWKVVNASGSVQRTPTSKPVFLRFLIEDNTTGAVQISPIEDCEIRELVGQRMLHEENIHARALVPLHVRLKPLNEHPSLPADFCQTFAFKPQLPPSP